MHEANGFLSDPGAQSRSSVDQHTKNSQVLDLMRTCAFSSSLVHRRLARGQMLFDNTGLVDALVIITSGQIKLVKSVPDGRQQIVGLLFTNDCIWHRYSPSDEFYAEAVSATTVSLIPGKRLVNALKLRPDLEFILLEIALSDLSASRNLALILGRMSAIERIAFFLMQMREKAVAESRSADWISSNYPKITLNMTRAEIADYLGLTIETVSRCLTKLRLHGLIKFIDLHTVELCDPDALTGIAEGRFNLSSDGPSRKHCAVRSSEIRKGG